MGFNIFGSSFFTALNNGVISAIISFMRTLLFQVVAVLILPIILGIDGVWLAVVFAEMLSLILTAIFVLKMKKRYNY
jgi:Na+-driven multidrug efflux pump